MTNASQPQVRYAPRGEAYLQIFVGGEARKLALDEGSTGLPPQWDARRAAPPVRAELRRVPGGHLLLLRPGVAARVNNRPVQKQHLCRGGDEIELEGLTAVYTTAQKELPTPMTFVVWPPEGASLEIRTHRARVSFGTGDADVVIDDPTLDGLHCLVRRYSSGVMQIEDKGSYNGVYVDRRKVVDGMNLRDGAEIRIGNSRVKAWTGAPSLRGGDEPRLVADDEDGLPAGGYEPHGAADGEALRPYAVELGPEFVGERRRTFEDDVPTDVEGNSERVDVRPQRHAADWDGYHANQEGAEDGPPDWAPDPANRPQPRAGGRRRSLRGVQEAETGEHWGRRDRAGITLVHGKDRPIKPRDK